MEPSFGICFDIDGVLMKSDKAIPEAKLAMKMLRGHKRVPHIFVTNGGGNPEDEKAAILQRELEVEVLASELLCSHTPMKNLVTKYRNDKILVVGNNKRRSEKILTSYGFTNLVCLEDLLVDRPLLVPWKKYSSTYSDPQPTKPTTTPDPIRAIFMLHEPVDWAEGLQVLSDVLQSNGIITADDFEPSEEQVVSMYIANPDWSYAAQFHKPRYTAGAFTKCLATLFEGSTGRKLKTTVFGKPFAEMHSYAETTLEALHGSPLNRVYMIGDNPKSDIRGANAMGDKWFSVLVRTGVFRGGDNDEENPAKHVAANVLEAIKFIFARENFHYPEDKTDV